MHRVVNNNSNNENKIVTSFLLGKRPNNKSIIAILLDRLGHLQLFLDKINSSTPIHQNLIAGNNAMTTSTIVDNTSTKNQTQEPERPSTTIMRGTKRTRTLKMTTRTNITAMRVLLRTSKAGSAIIVNRFSILLPSISITVNTIITISKMIWSSINNGRSKTITSNRIIRRPWVIINNLIQHNNILSTLPNLNKPNQERSNWTSRRILTTPRRKNRWLEGHISATCARMTSRSTRRNSIPVIASTKFVISVTISRSKRKSGNAQIVISTTKWAESKNINKAKSRRSLSKRTNLRSPNTCLKYPFRWIIAKLRTFRHCKHSKNSNGSKKTTNRRLKNHRGHLWSKR